MEEKPEKKRKNIDSPENLRTQIQYSNHSDKIICNLSYLDSQISKLQKSTYNPVFLPSFEQLLNAPSILNLAEKYEPMRGWPLTLEELEEKHLKLNESYLKFPDQKFIDQSTNTKNWLRFDIMLSIEYLKTFEFFDFLKIRDRIILAKHVSVIILSITFAFTSFQNKSDCLKTPDGCFIDFETISVILNSYTGQKNGKYEPFIQDHLKSNQNVMGFLIQEKLTKIEYLLLKSIAICDPIFELSEEARNIIWKNRRKFSKILFEFCQINYGKRIGPLRFSKLLNCLNLIICHEKNVRSFMFLGLGSSTNKYPKSFSSLEDTVFMIDK